ncbi:MAG: hypothetical protein Q4D60_11850 [Eubacteriales bacterium]|nr:hypothetical protein [Eubacteriales bacterium]
MKTRKKFMYAVSALFALCMVMTLTVRAEAAKMKTVIAEKNSVKLMDVPQFSIQYLDAESGEAGIKVLGDGSWMRVGIFDVDANLIVYKDCISYASFSGLSKNKVYYYSVQSLDDNKQPTSEWASPRAFTTILNSKVKLKTVKNKRVVKLKVPKIRGIKNYTVSISRKSDGKYKKIKTMKPGKKLTVSKFKNKAFKNGPYYIKVNYKTKDQVVCDDFKKGYVTFYTIYR